MPSTDNVVAKDQVINRSIFIVSASKRFSAC